MGISEFYVTRLVDKTQQAGSWAIVQALMDSNTPRCRYFFANFDLIANIFYGLSIIAPSGSVGSHQSTKF